MKKNKYKNLYYLKKEQEEYLDKIYSKGIFDAFSMIELILSLLIISIILAALTPVITKKANNTVKVDTTMAVYSAAECNKWFNEDCQVCTKNACLTCDKICKKDEYKNIGTCVCEKCNTRSKECIECGAKKCTKCREGYPLVEGVCADVPCAEGSWSDGLGGCLPCPSDKYCLDGLIYNRNKTTEDKTTAGEIDIPLDKYKREFAVTKLVGAGGAGGYGNFRQTSSQSTYFQLVCVNSYCYSCGCSENTGCDNYCCVCKSYGYRPIVTSVSSYASFGGGGGGAGAYLLATVPIPQDVIESAHGGSLKVITGTGTAGNGNPSSVSVVKNNITWWSISAKGGLKGNNASTTSAGTGGAGAGASNSCSAGANGSNGGGASNSAGAQGAGGGSGQGKGGKGGTVLVNSSGRTGEIAPEKGSNGQVKVEYIKLTR